ncbi:sulfate ABC transporter permease subunit CysT [Orbus wheelerorum]|uniref:sulfate ABC transporter permease subunit CysT n=1 Tax=Orbus wheelerorum TaxID=3074111 RepID=UPI00370DA10A
MQRTLSKTTVRIIPGFSITLGFTLTYISIIVLIPLFCLFIYSTELSLANWIKLVTGKQFLIALSLSLTTALTSALLNAFIGLLFAWVIVRYRFLGRKIIDTCIDMPFALPTAVAGIALTAIYAKNGPIGQLFSIKIAYTPIGITLALLFVTLPFVVRTLQPVIEDLPHELEEAAKILGATPRQTFIYIILPAILPAWLTGFTLAFARGIGEYGSVVFIAGNIPFKTEILPLLIVSKLDQYAYEAASAIGICMLVIAFILLFIMNLIQRRLNRAIVKVR